MTDVTDDEIDETEERRQALREILRIIRAVLWAVFVALMLRTFLFQPFTIPSASMEPNLYVGDYIIVSKYPYGFSRHSILFSPPLFKGRILERQAKRGDIVVFKLPSDDRVDYVKRVIGLPGDRVQMIKGELYVNDQLVSREQMSPVDEELPGGIIQQVDRFQERLATGRTFITQDYGTDKPLDNTPIYTVPRGYYFVMGDNRDNSADSRVPPAMNGVGYVPAENLEGKAEIILLSWKTSASLFKPWTWILDARPSRFFKVLK